ncbi:MAG: 3-isopropylmalate dehydratase small subunit [Vicinamibacterales bacterium]
MSAIDRISGTALPLRGDSIDTDRIMPARFLRAITFSGLEAHLFEDDRREADARAASGEGRPHPFSNPAYANAAILLVNANFGCGSSREHAPQALHGRGIRAVVGESFSEIFSSNAVALGMPCATAPRDAVVALMALVEQDPSRRLDVSLSERRVAAGGTSYPLTLPAGARESFLTGQWDATGLLLREPDAIARVAAALPYVSGF